MIFVGDDWAEDHHDVYVMDADGARLASRRLPEGLSGIRAFYELIADHAPGPTDVAIGIETDRGLWVQVLGAAGFQVFAINPLAVARYRERHQVSGAKSDAGDAKVLADLVRTDRHNHRALAGDSPEVEAIKVLARAHQNLIWARTRHTNAAFGAINNSPGARAFYDQHRAAGEVHHQALRALGNRLVGILHGCLRHHTIYREDTAWAHRTATAA
jgi:transposase